MGMDQVPQSADHAEVFFAYSISNKNTAEEKLPRQFLYRVESNTIIAYEKTYTFISALHFMYITRNE